ncbi:hypothetical protein PVAP13_3NG064713 [Panicum virgatum]|uniref:Uncharacterized protein n=1 Tax=Panicum virgatum TaxID=38727 RepID=A0A8T0TVG0_PANVG|nr:hypothetical protein PVAP13_3NG064713 [Panicum virgatum]KAG2615941.1 hypothetical protein PVAP13_3NG064713 [Panicum virgatum]
MDGSVLLCWFMLVLSLVAHLVFFLLARFTLVLSCMTLFSVLLHFFSFICRRISLLLVLATIEVASVSFVLIHCFLFLRSRYSFLLFLLTLACCSLHVISQNVLDLQIAYGRYLVNDVIMKYN